MKPSDLIPQNSQDNAPRTTDTTSKSNGGSISANVNQASADLAKSSFADGVNAARTSNDAFALGYVKARKKGTEQMLDTVASATKATAAAVAAVNLAEIEEGYGEIDPFSAGSISLLG